MDYRAKGFEQSEHDPDMIDVMVTLERPSPAELSSYDRAQKYQTLKENSTERRRELIAWIEKQELKKEVARIGEPTAFNTLFMTCTQRVAKLLPEAPGVVKVAPIDDIQLEL